MVLPPHAVIVYRYKFLGGVHDGTLQVLPDNVVEITAPALSPDFTLTQVEAAANIKSHGHAFPKETKFYYYTSTGRTEEGHLVMEMTGYVDNPIDRSHV